MTFLKIVLLLLVALIIGIFGAHNSTLAPVNFYPFELQLSVAVFLIFFFALFIGVILAGVVTAVKILHWRKLVRLKNREIARLEKELVEARRQELLTHGN